MMMNDANLRADPGLQAEIHLPDSVESLLRTIYSEQKVDPILPKTRRRLAAVSEEFASESLLKIVKNPVKHTLDGFICWLLNRDPDHSPGRYGGSPVTTPSPASGTPVKKRSPAARNLSFQGSLNDWVTRSPQPAIVRHRVSPNSFAMANETMESPQLKALGELEFRKAFLILNYMGSNRLEEVIAADEIRKLASCTMQKFESEVWNVLGRQYAKQEDRRRYLDWDYGKTHYYHCHVSPDGSYRFKGPFLENTTTHLHRVLGDENVMIVKFSNMPDKRCSSISDANHYFTSAYKTVAERGIMVGLRLYRFFVFKDGGREEKKKEPSSNGVKCYFVRTESRASVDMGKPYILSGKPIQEARMRFMHVHTLPSLASYMARFSLILSKTKKLDIDLSDINFELIDDISCLDEDGNDVYDSNGKPCIHSDGTGFISEDIASRCPINVYKGRHIKADRIEGKISELAAESCGQEPPLLIQFRMFYNGYAVKGTFLLNKKLPPRTVQVRPSMMKVNSDPNLLNFSTENSLEVVGTSNQPKRAKLSRNLIALLSYGNVPNEFFLDILYNTLEETKDVFCNKRAALKAALYYGDMDDLNAAKMILSGIPLDEPFLQHHLSILSKTERNDLKAGKLPISESYYLMGTVDPTGELEKDEVCVILESGHLSGEVLVYRNPGLHFGDVHILKARYVEALQEIIGNAKYGIFFPQKGPRSLADEIAGGDFDGDMYFISRNPELLKNFRGSEPWVCSSTTPNSDPHRKPSDYSAEELEDQLFDLFLKTRFQPSKTTGMAADSWLAIMDRLLVLGSERAEEKNRMKKTMLQLIDKYYDALDAPKKGAKVELPYELRAEAFPHYMEREKSFKSTSILGLIYDMVKSYQIEDVRKPEPRKLSCFEDGVVPVTLMDKWRSCYNSYKTEMSKAMQLESGDRKDAANEIIQRYKQELYGAPELEQSRKDLCELYQEALAIYHVVYDYAMNLHSVEKCGFAWKVAGAVLCRMYVERQEERSVLCSSDVLKEVLG